MYIVIAKENSSRSRGEVHTFDSLKLLMDFKKELERQHEIPSVEVFATYDTPEPGHTTYQEVRL